LRQLRQLGLVVPQAYQAILLLFQQNPRLQRPNRQSFRLVQDFLLVLLLQKFPKVVNQEKDKQLQPSLPQA
jgi:hypothetical protein